MNIISLITNYFNKQKNSELPSEYWVGDPDLGIKDFFYQKKTYLPINVSGYYGGGYDINSSKGRSANCRAVIGRCLENIFIKEKLPTNWAATRELKVNPIAGIDLNAYYDRKSLNFFYYFDYKIRKNIYTSDSFDIVSHELGHAILDAIRPDFWNVQNYEIWALHESFSDIIAILNILENEQIINFVSKETKGDLSKSNTASRLAEHFAKTVYNVTKGKNNINANFLRDAVNDFDYKNPLHLPDEATDDKLSRECHSFSRIWTGCFYDIFIELYKKEKNYNDEISAIKNARDLCYKYFFGSIYDVPCTNKLFFSLAQKILKIDKDHDLKNYDIIKNIFEKRNIDTSIKKVSIQNFIINNEKTLKVKIDKNLIDKKLTNCFVEIPFENKYEFTQDGSISVLSQNDLEENIDCAIACINSITKDKTIKKLFKLKNKNLIRQKIIN